MQLNHLQSLIRRQANEINRLHGLQALDKKYLKRAEHDDTKKLYKEFLSKRSKELKKLAVLQRALKTEIYHTLLDEAFVKSLENGTVNMYD